MDGNGKSMEPLVMLEVEIRALEAALEFASDDKEIDALGRRLDALETEISLTEARSPAGVAVKVRRLWESVRQEPEDWDENNFQTILRSLEKLHADFSKARTE